MFKAIIRWRMGDAAHISVWSQSLEMLVTWLLKSLWLRI